MAVILQQGTGKEENVQSGGLGQEPVGAGSSLQVLSEGLSCTFLWETS